jgi:hypothetical protein
MAISLNYKNNDTIIILSNVPSVLEWHIPIKKGDDKYYDICSNIDLKDVNSIS